MGVGKNRMKMFIWRIKDNYFKKRILNLYREFFFRKFKYTKPYFINSDLRKNVGKHVKKNSLYNFLEIGTFEGLASAWINKKFLHSNGKHVIVDPFTDTVDLTTDVDKMVEKNFYYNYGRFSSKNTTFIRNTSNAFFEVNNTNFDFIYIDGSHELENIESDLENSHKFINKGGIIWCDDYLGGEFPNLCKIPIDNFFKKYHEQYEIIFRDYQIAYRKI